MIKKERIDWCTDYEIIDIDQK